MTADDEQDPNDWLRNLLGGHRADSRDAIVGAEQDSNDWLRHLLADRSDSQHALVSARVARAGGRAPDVEYRCSSTRCLLGQVFVFPEAGPVIYTPAYRFSPGARERQRANRREWDERAFRLTPLIEANRTPATLAATPGLGDAPTGAARFVVQVQCEHLFVVLDPAEVAADVRTGRRVRLLAGPGA